MPSGRNLAAILFLAVLFGVVYVSALGSRPLLIPDETRYAETPREMLKRGSWLSPTLNGTPYFEKPSPAYWPAIASMKLFGENAFAVRLPYALATGVSALLVLLLAKRAKRKDEELFPYLAAAVFLCMAEVFGVGTFAVLDPLLALFIAGTMLCFFAAWEAKASPLKSQALMLLAGLLAGGAFMVKGFLGILLPGAAIGAFLLWMRDWRALFTLPWAALIGTLAAALPWAALQHRAEPDFWRYFIMVEHLGRFAGEGAERHPQPFWFYVPVLLGGIAPFTLYAYSLIRGGAKLDWKEPFNRFLAAWAIVPFLALSLSSGKLGTYILPLFPALAILTIVCLRSSFENFGPKSYFAASYVLLGLLGLGLVAELACAILKISGLTSGVLVDTMIGASFGAPFLLLFFSLRSSRGSKGAESFALNLFCLCATILLLFLNWPWTAHRPLDASKAPESFIASNAKLIPGSMKVAASADLAGAVCWSLKREDVEIFRKEGEFAYGLEKSGRKLIGQDELRRLFEVEAPKEGLAAFVPSRLVKKCLPELKESEGRKLIYASSGHFSCVILPPAAK